MASGSQAALQGRHRDAQLLGDVGQCPTLGTQFDGEVDVDLGLRAPTDPAPAAGSGKPGADAVDEHLALELRECRHKVQEQPPLRRRGVERFGDAHKVDPQRGQLFERVDHVLERPEEAVAAPHDEDVELAPPGRLHERVEAGTPVTRAADAFVGERVHERPAPAVNEVGGLVALQVGLLVVAADAEVAGDGHTSGFGRVGSTCGDGRDQSGGGLRQVDRMRNLPGWAGKGRVRLIGSDLVRTSDMKTKSRSWTRSKQNHNHPGGMSTARFAMTDTGMALVVTDDAGQEHVLPVQEAEEQVPEPVFLNAAGVELVVQVEPPPDGKLCTPAALLKDALEAGQMHSYTALLALIDSTPPDGLGYCHHLCLTIMKDLTRLGRAQGWKWARGQVRNAVGHHDHSWLEFEGFAIEPSLSIRGIGFFSASRYRAQRAARSVCVRSPADTAKYLRKLFRSSRRQVRIPAML